MVITAKGSTDLLPFLPFCLPKEKTWSSLVAQGIRDQEFVTTAAWALPQAQELPHFMGVAEKKKKEHSISSIRRLCFDLLSMLK